MCTNPRTIIINKEEYTVKCGKCDTCRRERQSEWAIKLINEEKYHTKACFITLTFDNKILLSKNTKINKYGANLSFIYHIDNSKEYFKKFMKRLRKKLNNKKLTYYHVAEYGEKTKRPHHHLLLFGENFENERIEIEKSKSGHTQYWSETIYNLWGCGRISIENCNENNIIYISQYALKKFKDGADAKRYEAKQSFSNRSKMSTKWARRNYNEIIKGYIDTEDGKRFRIPKSYKETLKNSIRPEHKLAYENFEENLQNFILEHNQQEELKNQKIREIQWRKRNKFKIRDCTDFD